MHDMLDPKGVMGVVDFYAKRCKNKVGGFHRRTPGVEGIRVLIPIFIRIHTSAILTWIPDYSAHGSGHNGSLSTTSTSSPSA